MKIVRDLVKVASLITVATGAQATSLPLNFSEWDNVAIGGGGFVTGIIPSETEQNLVYARTDVGGAYRWDVPTDSWIPLLDWVAADQKGYLGVESLALDPSDASRLYLFVGIDYFDGGKSAILRSSDYGNSFEIVETTSQFKAHGNGMGRQSGERLVVDPNNSDILYLGTRRDGLFKSVDQGKTWSQLAGFPVTSTANDVGVSFVLVDENSASGGASERIIVGVARYTSDGDNLYLSEDGGQSFSAIANAPQDDMPQQAVLSSQGKLFITYANGGGPHGHWSLNEPVNQGSVWKYQLSTSQWQEISPSLSAAFSGISLDSANEQRLLLTTVNSYLEQASGVYGDRILLSTDEGASWQDLFADSPIQVDTSGVSWIQGHSIHWAADIEFDPFDSDTAWVISGNGIFKNEQLSSAAQSWAFDVAGLEETVPLDLISIPSGPVISAIGDYDGFVHTDVSQYAPIHQPQMGTTTGVTYAPLASQKVARVGNKLYLSEDQGSSWSEAAMASSAVKGHVTYNADGTVLLHSPESGSSNYRTTDGGASWQTISGVTNTGLHFAADPLDANTLYVNDQGQFKVSTDKGASFTTRSSLAATGQTRLAVVPDRSGHVWVALNDAGLAYTSDGGQSFTSAAEVTNCIAVGTGKTAQNASYPTLFIYGTVNGIEGIYRSVDQGQVWLRISDLLYGGPGNGAFVIGDSNTFDVVYMSTAGRGLLVGKGDQGVTPPQNDSPQISTGQTASVAENSTTAQSLLLLQATDAESDLLSGWRITSGNEAGWFAVDSNTGELSLVAGAALDFESQASYPLGVQVSDGFSMSSVETVTIQIEDVNESPELASSLPTLKLAEGESVSTSIASNFSDPEQDSLSYSASELPDGLQLSSSGLLSGTLSTAGYQQLPLTLTVTVSDGDLEISQSWTLQAKASTTPTTPSSGSSSGGGSAPGLAIFTALLCLLSAGRRKAC